MASQYWRQYDNSKRFSKLDVFYNYLGSDPQSSVLASLKSQALNSFENHLNNVMQVSKNVEPYRRIAEYEKEKELALLSKVFNKDLQINLQDSKDVKTLIDALNSVLNIKEVYERNIRTLELSKGGRKSVISFFPTYFLQVWDERWRDIYNATSTTFSMGGITLEEALKKEIDNVVDDITITAIERMLSAKAEMKTMREEEKYNTAYSELLNAIRNVPKYRNEILERIRSIYQLDKISEGIAKELKGENQKITRNQIGKRLKTSAKKPISFKSGSRGGYTLEAIEKMSFNLIAESLEEGRAVHTGQMGNMKADNMLIIGVDGSIIDEWLEEISQISGSSRKDNLERIEKLQELTKGVNEGFIVYSNDKNWTLNKNFRDQFGFPAGTAISAQSYYDVTRKVNKNARTFVGLMLNTIQGAIMGTDAAREDLAKAIATDIAVMLFDDYQTIGDFRKQTGPKAIHIMNLGNIMVPLSVFLTMLANAVERAETDVDDFVKVVITTPEIEFKDYAAQKAWMANPTKGYEAKSAWSYQRDEALKKTRISVNFLKEFRAFITSLGK